MTDPSAPVCSLYPALNLCLPVPDTYDPCSNCLQVQGEVHPAGLVTFAVVANSKAVVIFLQPTSPQQFSLVNSNDYRTSGTIATDLLYVVCQSIRSGLGSVPCEGRKQRYCTLCCSFLTPDRSQSGTNGLTARGGRRVYVWKCTTDNKYVAIVPKIQQ